MLPSEIDIALKDLETSIERLHALYNQYFMGIERTEPTVHRKNVDRKIYALRKLQLHNTSQRFRLQTQIQKYNTHANHWKRICREIEEGTYKKHIDLAKRRQRERIRKEEELRKQKGLDSQLGFDGMEEQNEPLPVFEIDLDGFDFDDPFDDDVSPGKNPSSNMMEIDDPFAENPVPQEKAAKKKVQLPKPSVGPDGPAWSGSPEKKATLPRPKPTTPKSSPVESGRKPEQPVTRTADQGLDKARAAKIYKTYLAALKKCSQSTANITLEKVERSLKKKVESGGGNVDFKVVIKGGKASIKAVKKDQ